MLFKRCQSIMCCSRSEQALLVKDVPSCAARTVVIPPAIGTVDSFNVEPFPKSGPIVLSTGRLDTYKNVDKIVRATGRLDASVRLVVTGEGPARPVLEELTDSLAIRGRVQFVGHVSEHDLRRWQKTADVVALLSTHESFGLSLAEALAAGASVVASDIEAHREVSEFVSGDVRWVTIDAGDAQIAAELAAAIASPRDRGGVPTLRSWDEVGVEIAAVYRELVDQSSP
jgi:glycosyltransferase involved in cell wall biosynthesis